jgi:hypothetical protein
VVKCNDLNQPIGKEAGRFGYFLGTVARNGKLCSLSSTDWRKIIGETYKKNNEQKNKKDILGQVQVDPEYIKYNFLTLLCFIFRAILILLLLNM